MINLRRLPFCILLWKYTHSKVNAREARKRMAKKGKDYFGLSYVVSLILAIIPITSWICGAVTRFSEGKIVAGLIRLIFGFTIVWILDIILMITNRQILRLLNV